MANPNPNPESAFQIRKFDVGSMKCDSTIAIIGKRRTGKSFLTRDLMYHYRRIPRGVVFSGTEHASPFFCDFVPDLFIFKGYHPDILKKMLEKQSKRIKAEGGQKPKNNIFFVMDDLLSESQIWKKDPLVKELFMNGRHYNVYFILTMQYPLGITPDLRTNIDYIFIFKENNLKNRRTIYEHYAGMIPTFEMFCDILDQCTEEHQCLVIRNSGISNKLEDILFWYKAEPHDNFRMGDDKFWKVHKKNYDRDHDRKPDEDIIKVTSDVLKQYGNMNKRNKMRIVVEKKGCRHLSSHAPEKHSDRRSSSEESRYRHGGGRKERYRSPSVESDLHRPDHYHRHRRRESRRKSVRKSVRKSRHHHHKRSSSLETESTEGLPRTHDRYRKSRRRRTKRRHRHHRS